MRKRMVKILAACVPALAVAVLWVRDASAVECVSPDLTMSCYRTIQEAVGVATLGELVEVYPGLYPENVSIDTAGVQVVGRGGWPGQVVIDPTVGVGVSLNAPQAMLKNVTVRGAEIGLTATGAGATIDDVIVNSSNTGISVSSDGVRVMNSAVRQIVGTGIVATGANFVVLSSIVQQIGGQCVQVNGDGAIISKSRIMDCGEEGVKVTGSSAQILENDLHVAGMDLIQIEGPGARIHNNTLQGGRRNAISVKSDSLSVVSNAAYDCDSGIDVYCDSCVGALLAENVSSDIYDCPGFTAIANSVGMVVRDNTSRGSSYEGFVLQGWGIVAHRNKAIDSGFDGIHVQSPSSGVRLLENIAKRNARDGIRIGSGVIGTGLKMNRASANGGFDYFNAGTGTVLGTGTKRNYFGTTGCP